MTWTTFEPAKNAAAADSPNCATTAKTNETSMDTNQTAEPESFKVEALRARFADKSMPWTRAHVESLINQIAELTKQRDEGWKNYYTLRKQVAEERYPGMTGVVRALDVGDKHGV
jgi:hypothetical protein